MLDLTKKDGVPWVAEPHTPTPWSEFAESGDWWIQQSDAEGNPTGSTVVTNANDMSAANMGFIITACNTHDALVAACEDAYLALLQSIPATRIRARRALAALRDAIASARGQEPMEVQNEFEAKAQADG